MKKLVIFWLSSAFVLLPLGAHAEPSSRMQQRMLDLGLGLGLDIANLIEGNTSDDSLSLHNIYEYSLAGFSTVRLHDYVSVQVELRYDRKGSDLELREQPIGSRKFVYLEVPILARPQLPVHEAVTLYGLAGLGLGYLLSAESINENGDSSDAEEEFKSFDLGLIVGIGAGIAAFPRQGELRLDVRYVRSLIDTDDTANTSTIKNRTFSFFLSYRVYGWTLPW